MEFRIIFEREEIGRVFTGLGTIFTHFMGIAQQPRRLPIDPVAGIDASGIMRGAQIGLRDGERQAEPMRSMADVMNLMARFQEGEGRGILPARAEGEHEHRYAYLQTEHGQDIYVCQEDRCERRLAIPGRIVLPAPLEEITEVRTDEEPSRGEQPPPAGLPPAEREEDPGTHPPP